MREIVNTEVNQLTFEKLTEFKRQFSNEEIVEEEKQNVYNNQQKESEQKIILFPILYLLQKMAKLELENENRKIAKLELENRKIAKIELENQKLRKKEDYRLLREKEKQK